MFREIRTSERITDKDREIEREIRYWQNELFDSRIGSDRWNEAKKKLDELRNR